MRIPSKVLWKLLRHFIFGGLILLGIKFSSNEGDTEGKAVSLLKIALKYSSVINRSSQTWQVTIDTIKEDTII